jgi:putative DNA methylase
MSTNDRRLIEDFLPIKEISAESSREKSLRHGHISTLHLWWARRPLVACRAAVYASLVPADFHAPKNGPENKRASLGRANAAKFLKELCRYPGNPQKIEEAKQNILKAHFDRTGEKGPPKVLDCFAGGGSIPLEALRLGCEAYALELNPVAHLIELCTLVYPQKYGKSDLNAVGCEKGKWAGLAKEVEYWGKWVLEKVKAEIGDLYPPIPIKDAKSKASQSQMFGNNPQSEFRNPQSYLTPVAYLWTRTVPCKNPGCGAVVPLVRQTWLCKKPGRYIALRISPSPYPPRGEGKIINSSSPMEGHKTISSTLMEDSTSFPSPLMGENSSSPSPLMGEGKGGGEKLPIFTVVRSSARSEIQAIEEFGFDPGEFSKGGNAACIFCGTVADIDYVKGEGWQGRMGQQIIAVVCSRPHEKGKVYLSPYDSSILLPDSVAIQKRINLLCEDTQLKVPAEPIANLPHDCRDNSLGITVRPYGLRTFADLFSFRQLLVLLVFTKWVRKVYEEMTYRGYNVEGAKAVATMLGLWVDKIADFGSSLTHWHTTGEKLSATFSRQALPMVWDFPEINPFCNSLGNAQAGLSFICEALRLEMENGKPPHVTRGNATELPYEKKHFDAVVTDPPYYDNVPYSDLSDFFYVWLKQSVGHLYPEHFASELTPKRGEAIADPFRQSGKERAKHFYEEMMLRSLNEMQNMLKPDGILTMVYAHKTVAGWSTLVNALKEAQFMVTEAWPLETEMGSRLRAMESSALASSIFLVARKRDNKEGIGDYSTVRAELEKIVRERVQTLWNEGITGADLIIACVGAGLKAFTQYERVELPNGEEVSSERFLTEVEGVVQETILEFLFGSKSKISSVDAPTRFYILWRYAYGRSEIDAGEAIVFSYPLGVEIDGSQGLSTGKFALLEKKGKKYRLKDYSERGEQEHLGIEPRFGAIEKPLIDVLHRLLWLMENRTLLIKDFLDQAMPNTEELRLVAQALSGSSLQGGGLKLTTDAEQSALQKLLSNWRSVVEDNLFRKR